jgi:hypothetical protein
MSRLLFAGVEFAVERHNPHPLHQGFNTLSTDRDALPMELIAQHWLP